MKVLLDTNIILDIALMRRPFCEDAIKIFENINTKTLYGYISATTVTDIFYFLRKEYGKEKALNFLKELIKVIDVIGIDGKIISNALETNWSDFEDAVQAQAALENEIDVIITRNTKDYKLIRQVKILSPSDFLYYFSE
ncbi:MAG: PIN domain-containing protein [Prevotellaceae bacterium]|jgi:predicted nucleic acid-binding protein|nr:PIN domain-containing protein [Prevotellaceae bacterium]